MGAFQLGAFTIKYEWIMILFSGMITYIVIKNWTKEDRKFQTSFLDTIFNALIIGFLIYKFSLALFKPALIFDNPLGLLYFTGGIKGAFLGVSAAFFYVVWKMKKEKWLPVIVFKGLIYIIATFFLSFWVFRTLFFLIF
ncbi:hypothetical protein H1Z61_15920 [Bacillus aquiflavi]|uniref:Uncharacterized protein n=1 Tax=Bacillus aquiflavi TaxID=2672567 RepID=A0A6B3W368_9BACI|nr:hypothetical protein [Bacillus aquiflavi]MBA4538574.1 hypothetical protein [Bacillus aquiflavi]NEY82937.1 hypothetical protein [Bacillus aquiflavi]